MTALVLAAGLIGYARVGDLDPDAGDGGGAWAAVVWVLLGRGWSRPASLEHERTDWIAFRSRSRRRKPRETWRWIEQVGPRRRRDRRLRGRPPRSRRGRRLYGYIVEWNLPFRAIRSSIREFAGCSSGTTILSSKCCWTRVSRSSTREETDDRASSCESAEDEILIFWNFARTQNGDRMSILGTARWRVARASSNDRREDGCSAWRTPSLLAWVLEGRARCPVASMSREPNRSP